MVKAPFNTDCLPDVLPLYYKRLFPFDSYFKWLSYGNKEFFSRREFSMTYNGDIYVRYQSFENQEELMNLICKKVPCKIDIGAIFNAKPKMHNRVESFDAVEKELVIDIDMTDYDEVRTCCKDAAICQKCWKFMIIACKVIDAALREDFGLNNLLWVFSGRRGIHCWACDEKARKYTAASRISLAEYLTIVTGGDQKRKKVKLYGDYMHSSLSRSYKIAEPYFKEICLIDQDILGTKKKVVEFIKLTSNLDDSNLEQELLKLPNNSETRWEKFLEIYRDKKGPKKHQFLVEEIILQYLYPRIDINVTKGLNHLLKSPFCIHPKTGNVCIPFTASNVDKFNPLSVPTIDILIEELNSFDEKVRKEQETTDQSEIVGTPSILPRIKDYKKTSLYKGIVVFDNFVRSLETLQTISMEF